MSNENIPKDYDFKKEKIWEQKWEDEELYKFLGLLRDGTVTVFLLKLKLKKLMELRKMMFQELNSESIVLS